MCFSDLSTYICIVWNEVETLLKQKLSNHLRRSRMNSISRLGVSARCLSQWILRQTLTGLVGRQLEKSVSPWRAQFVEYPECLTLQRNDQIEGKWEFARGTRLPATQKVQGGVPQRWNVHSDRSDISLNSDKHQTSINYIISAASYNNSQSHILSSWLVFFCLKRHLRMLPPLWK